MKMLKTNINMGLQGRFKKPLLLYMTIPKAIYEDAENTKIEYRQTTIEQ